MNWLTVIWAAGAGLALGVFYFGGLWLTVRKLLGSPRPALLVAGSLAARLAAAAVLLLLMARSGWQALLAAGAGIFVARTLLVHFLGPQGRPQPDNPVQGNPGQNQPT